MAKPWKCASSFDFVMARILLHVCCGPCAIMPITRLLGEGHEIVAWFMNPNIQPLSEYLRRREAAEICARNLGIGIIFEDDAWNLGEWLQSQLPRAQSAARCVFCCGQRVLATAEKARALGFDAFSTTLLYSRYQPHEAIAAAGCSVKTGAEFVYRDFRTDWQEGIDRSREMGLYRQPYCGCVFSEAERYAKKLNRLKNSPQMV